MRTIGRVQHPVSQPVNQGAGIIGNAVRLRVDVEIAHRFLFSQPVSVMNLDDLSKRFQIPFDGVLGQDILSQIAVRLDRLQSTRHRVGALVCQSTVFVAAILPIEVTETPARLGDVLPLQTAICFRSCVNCRGTTD